MLEKFAEVNRLTPSAIDYYRGTYERHREATPLPPGWTCAVFTSSSEVCELTFRFYDEDDDRTVSVDVPLAGEVNIHFDSDSCSHEWTPWEVSTLLYQLIGLELAPAQIEADMASDIRAVRRKGRFYPTSVWLTVSDDVFKL